MFTTHADLYDKLCEVVTTTTGRRVWSKSGIQATPNSPYATVFLSQGEGFVFDVVQTVEIIDAVGDAPSLQEIVWGATRFAVEVEFYRDSTTSTAYQAAAQFRNGLHREARYNDIWTIAGLSGNISIVDMSAIFRADTENRVRVMFNLYANILDPIVPEASIYEIDSTTVNVACDEITITKTISRI
jgi:hypothetical protein